MKLIFSLLSFFYIKKTVIRKTIHFKDTATQMKTIHCEVDRNCFYFYTLSFTDFVEISICIPTFHKKSSPCRRQKKGKTKTETTEKMMKKVINGDRKKNEESKRTYQRLWNVFEKCIVHK